MYNLLGSASFIENYWGGGGGGEAPRTTSISYSAKLCILDSHNPAISNTQGKQKLVRYSGGWLYLNVYLLYDRLFDIVGLLYPVFDIAEFNYICNTATVFQREDSEWEFSCVSKVRSYQNQMSFYAENSC